MTEAQLLNLLRTVFHKANQKMVESQSKEGQKITAALFDTCGEMLGSIAVAEMLREARDRGKKNSHPTTSKEGQK